MKKYVLPLLLLIIETLSFYFLSYYLNVQNESLFLLYFFLQFMFGHYKIVSNLIWDEIKLLIRSHFSYMIILIILLYPISIGMLIRFLIINIIMFLICFASNRWWRIIFRSSLARNTIIIGTGEDAYRFAQVAKNNRFALTDVKGFIHVDNEKISDNLLKEDEDASRYRIYKYEELDKVFIECKIDQAVIAVTNISDKGFKKIVSDIKDKVQYIKYLPKLEVILSFDSMIQDFDGLLLISTARNKMGIIPKTFKRLVDICAGIVGCLLLLPLTLIIKQKYKKDGDTDPVFFAQERIGKNGKKIKIYKYRSMIVGAEQVLEDLMNKDPKIKEEYLKNKKLVNDPRITKTGAFLRKSSLDEFPQFINVLKGEMSLVGPRPYLPREKEDMSGFYDTIIECKPGITGMWQANGRSDIGFTERCEMDDYYYKNWTFGLDLIIIYKTIKSVLYGKGAL